MTKTRSILVVVVLLAAVAVVAVTAPREGSAPVAAPQSVSPLPSAAALLGTWRAQGVVEMSEGAGDQPEGTTLTREWVFFESCAGKRCQPWLARETSDTLEQARYDGSANPLRVVFTRGTEGCDTVETGQLTRTFQITGAQPAGQLRASETVRGRYPQCGAFGGDGTVESTLRWKVTKVSGACPGLPGCRRERQP